MYRRFNLYGNNCFCLSSKAARGMRTLFTAANATVLLYVFFYGTVQQVNALSATTPLTLSNTIIDLGQYSFANILINGA